MSEKNEFYANSVNVFSSLYDITLNFNAQSVVVIDQNKPQILQSSNECTIRMSPQHAKALVALLTDQIKKYEENFKFELPLEEPLLSLWKANIK
ncbi:MAG: DUF3467 domain-containing protein [Anaerolineales bacterium]|nr:DUF3467 domain-containing protein [Anaerolineales bacterium]